jgi:hypothetical protein
VQVISLDGMVDLISWASRVKAANVRVNEDCNFDGKKQAASRSGLRDLDHKTS